MVEIELRRKNQKEGWYKAWDMKLGPDEMLIILTRNKSGQYIEIPIRGTEE